MHVALPHCETKVHASRQALQSHLMSAGDLLRANALDPQPLFEGLIQPSLFEELV